MAQILADRRDVDFVLYDQLRAADFSSHDAFREFNRKTMDLIVSEARTLAIKELLPVYRTGDEEGCRFDSGKVVIPEAFYRVYELIRDGEWIALTDSAQWGGQEMPHVLAQAVYNYFLSANFPAMTYATLTHGAAKLVEVFGTDRQKTLFLKNMYSGKWSGTMLLTEPEAGSDVGALATTAEKNEDGTYSITGSKIFITSGEHDLTENIIHPVLARIKGAPEGTRGISLFLVPKFLVNDDGSLGQRNGIVCTGIEEKMGIHGSATCSMSMGASTPCIGELLGEENKGMRAMFVMMNEARLGVGLQGFACASASFLNALNYARERVQGKSLASGGKGNSVPIIQHPDVRRMLMTMKAYTEGMRSLLFYTAWLEDMSGLSDSAEEKARHQGLIEVLIPIAKGYVTDRAFDVCSIGVQVFGGYGYTKEFPQEQLLRDCRITQIYEGTNGIQAMDLLGRKLTMDNGRQFNSLMDEITALSSKAAAYDTLSELASDLSVAVEKIKETALFLAGAARSQDAMNAFAFASPFMDSLGDIIMAWMLLWRAETAAGKLAAGAPAKEIPFLEGQLASARFFIRTQIPVTHGKMASVMKLDSTVVDLDDKSFGGL